MLIATCFDSGSPKTAATVVALDGGRFRFLWGRRFRLGGGFYASGQLFPDFGDDTLDMLLDDAKLAGGIVGIEHLVGFAYEAKRVAYLLETRDVQGQILHACRVRGLVPHVTSAPEWRGEFCRTAGPSNEQIAIVLEGAVVGIPPLHHEDREHIYDAGGLCVVELCRAAHLPIPRSPEVETKLYRQQQLDKAQRAAKRAKREAGELAPEKRRPSGAMRARRAAGAKKGWETRRGVTE